MYIIFLFFLILKECSAQYVCQIKFDSNLLSKVSSSSFADEKIWLKMSLSTRESIMFIGTY